MTTSYDSLLLPALQAIGIMIPTMLGGANVGISIAAIPPLQHASVSASTAAQQWQALYKIGKAVAPPTTAIAALCNAYLLYRSATSSWPATPTAGVSASSSPSPDPTLLALSIAGQLAIIPFTLLLMEGGTNRRLAGFAAQGRKGALEGKADKARVSDELQTWKWMNLARAALSVAGAGLGLWAAR